MIIHGVVVLHIVQIKILDPLDDMIESIENYFEFDDLNGDFLKIISEGEDVNSTINDANEVVFLADTPYAHEILDNVNMSLTQAIAFLYVNFDILKDMGLGLTDLQCLKLSFIKYYAVRQGLVSPDFHPDDYHVKYTEVRILSNVSTDAYEGIIELLKEPESDEAKANDFIQTLIAFPSVKDEMKLKFANMICTVAYVFFVRGHHYKTEYQSVYERVWRRVALADVVVDNDLTWHQIATIGTHAIYPIILDKFWKFATEQNRIAGALSLRYDSSPAGMALWRALKNGLMDVKNNFPGVETMSVNEQDYLNVVIEEQQADRYTGSINATYYGSARVRYDEGKVANVAAVVRGIYDSLAEEHALLGSKALERVANRAPVTQGLIGRAARIASASETFQTALTYRDT